MENSARILALVKIGNVGLTMLWGFAVTYVFVRLLPLHEFRAFLLLVAFGNFTVSAELGLTSIAYNRLRRHWLAAKGQGDASDFRAEELGVLVALLGGLMLASTVMMIGAVLSGIISTTYPWLFILFFLTACLNLFATLSKRALAAVDRNMLWEGLDIGRRLASLLLLFAALHGLDITISVLLQLLLTIATVLLALSLLHRRLSLKPMQWLALRVGGGHVRKHYLADFGASAALTVSEVAAYNAPYFLIALATHDPRPLLLFDFLFKMSRALSALVRATIEAALPRITAAWYRGDAPRFRQLLLRGVAVASVMAASIAAALMVIGPQLVSTLFDGKLVVGRWELALIGLLLLGLGVTCVSVYVQAALGRFRLLLRQSLPFLAGSLLCVPVSAFLATPTMPFMAIFPFLVVATYLGTGILHAFALRRLSASVA
ncbi:hypothetical protein [Sphingobium sp. SCG-1]|uniref:hypothetical protein n=1 Tax=Sphingobium sp. SCG-1 TaxID=2072936 RepID=UPI001CB9BB6B|nr:hypothetical protein [Sphingobium sp. SCG-1]